jgi:hypothetical protein
MLLLLNRQGDIEGRDGVQTKEKVLGLQDSQQTGVRRRRRSVFGPGQGHGPVQTYEDINQE